jgi:hypothetical protein
MMALGSVLLCTNKVSYKMSLCLRITSAFWLMKVVFYKSIKMSRDKGPQSNEKRILRPRGNAAITMSSDKEPQSIENKIIRPRENAAYGKNCKLNICGVHAHMMSMLGGFMPSFQEVR